MDWLHTLSLGAFQEFLAFLFAHMMYVDNVWRVAGPPETILRVSVKRLEAELFSWYATEERAGRIHTRVQFLAAGMFGTTAAPKYKLHGAETNGVLTFSLALLNKYADQLSNRRRLVRLGEGLARTLSLIRTHKYLYPPSAIQDGRRLCCACGRRTSARARSYFRAAARAQMRARESTTRAGEATSVCVVRESRLLCACK